MTKNKPPQKPERDLVERVLLDDILDLVDGCLLSEFVSKLEEALVASLAFDRETFEIAKIDIHQSYDYREMRLVAWVPETDDEFAVRMKEYRKKLAQHQLSEQKRKESARQQLFATEEAERKEYERLHAKFNKTG